jgi:hypothetical protein
VLHEEVEMKTLIVVAALITGIVAVAAQTCRTWCTDFPKGYHQCITTCR